MAGINSNTVLMLHMNGTNGSTSFPDDSPMNHTVTAVGNAQVSTSQKVFGTGSLLLDGSGDYLTVPDNDCWDFGTGAWTVDMRYRPDVLSPTTWHHLLDIGDGYGGNGVRAQFASDGSGGMSVQIKIGGTSYTFNKASASTGTWYYLKFGRDGNYLKLYLDETQLGSDTDITGKDITSTTTGVYVGDAPNDGAGNETELDGMIDELRIQKGEWDGTFASEEYTLSAGGVHIPIWW